MEQDKNGKQYSAKTKASLESLAQIPGHASTDDEILIKREDTSVSFGSLHGDLLNPIQKKLKVEGVLQEGYEPKARIFVVKNENGDVFAAKQEETGHNVNVKLEDSHSQIAGQEDSEKPESNQCHSQEWPYQTGESTSGKSKRDSSYSSVKPKALYHKEELGIQKEKQTKKEKRAERDRNYYQNNKEKWDKSNRNLKKINKEKCAKSGSSYYQNNKEKCAENHRNYYQNNKEKINQQAKNWQKNNKEKSAEIGRNWQKNNKEKSKESSRHWHKNNKEKVAEIDRNYRQNNKEKCAASHRNWQKKNKEKCAEHSRKSYHIMKEKMIRPLKNCQKKNKEKCNESCRNCQKNKAEYIKNHWKKNREKIAERVRIWYERNEEKEVRQPQIDNPAQSYSVKPQPRPKPHNKPIRRSSYRPLTSKPTPRQNPGDTIRQSAEQSTGLKDFYKLRRILSPAPTPSQEEPHDFNMVFKKDPTQEECRSEVKKEDC